MCIMLRLVGKHSSLGTGTGVRIPTCLFIPNRGPFGVPETHRPALPIMTAAHMCQHMAREFRDHRINRENAVECPSTPVY